MLRTLLAFALVLIPASVRADDKKADKPRSEPAGTPLELAITGKLKYPYDTIGFTLEEYKAAIKLVEQGKKKLPMPPFVDLKVEIKNTSDKAIKVWVSGDPVVLALNLKGPGAFNFDPPMAFTEEFRLPQSVEIAAGKSHTITLTSLRTGFRGQSHYSYWTDAGEYELSASFKTAMMPAPNGAKEGMDGFGLVTLWAAPVKLTIEKK